MKKKILMLALVCAVTATMCSCTAEQAADTVNDYINSMQTSDSKEVKAVKNGYLESYSTDKTVGEALDDFLGNPMWQYFVADGGEHIVECNGTCTYKDKEVQATIQFQLNDDDTFEIYTMGLNDISQNPLVIAGFFEKVFE